MILDLNQVLAPIDRRAARFSQTLSRKLYVYSMRGGFEDSQLELKDKIAAELLEYMWSAHLLGVQSVRAMSCASGKQPGKKPGKEQASAMREFYGSIARSASDKMMSQVRDKMLGSVQALISGKPKDYRAQLRGVVSKAAPKHLVNTIERTQTSLAFNAAAWAESYDDEGLWGYSYTTAGDERVRATHKPFDGVRYPKDDPFWHFYAPPNGWNCRCGLTPVYGAAKPRRYKGTPTVDKSFKWNAGALFTKT